jgi:hypothetical protein
MQRKAKVKNNRRKKICKKRKDGLEDKRKE